MEDQTRPVGGRVLWEQLMDDLKKISDLLSELSLLADEVQASTGEQPTAQEVIDWVQDFIDKEISTRQSIGSQEVHRQ